MTELILFPSVAELFSNRTEQESSKSKTSWAKKYSFQCL